MVTLERTGWRDLTINNRHRTWAGPLFMTDIDCIEFYNGRPVAVVELKCQFPKLLAMEGRYQTARFIACKLEIPYYILFYSLNKPYYAVQPMNQHAARFWAGRTLMSERDYVAALYELRGLKMPAEVGATLPIEEPDMRLWPVIESNVS